MAAARISHDCFFFFSIEEIEKGFFFSESVTQLCNNDRTGQLLGMLNSI